MTTTDEEGERQHGKTCACGRRFYPTAKKYYECPACRQDAAADRGRTPDLTSEQRARADALTVARRIVGRHTDGTVEALDIHALARFILTGEDPYVAIAAEQVRCNWPDEGSDATCSLPLGHDDHLFEVDDVEAVVRPLRRVFDPDDDGESEQPT